MDLQQELDIIIKNAMREDLGDGDHSSLSCVPSVAVGKAKLLVKEDGIIAGVDAAKKVFDYVDPNLKIETFIDDGASVKIGDIVFHVEGSSLSILKAERLVLNIMQRMSAVATKTDFYVDIVKGLKTKILDTRKTTPGIRALEKWAVKIGGGENHRFGLYDMVMLKDNHLDFAGGITKAINKTIEYLEVNNLDLRIEVEARDLGEVKEIMEVGGVHRIMLDNFSYDDTRTAVKLIGDKFETESSGGITEKTLRNYAECGVDFISIGALTHSVSSMDLSLKAI
ncbi:MAG: carboxylating nicotinate-nucleotide diphosphorylase [Flavobacteriales bacterium]|nr:carboxylating nicotinate-nucleotide diphosphorylase [Flavobacteriales bacterium]